MSLSLRALASVLAAAVISVVLFVGAAFAESGIYTVRGVPVDASGASATAARDLAIPKGRGEAWSRLFRRLVPRANWASEPQLDEATLDELIASFEVRNERSSSTRYLAEMTYTFNGDKVRSILRGAAIPFTETRARPALVIPILEGAGGAVLWGDNAFARAWGNTTFRDELAPIVVPSGDTEDLVSFPDASSVPPDWTRLEALAARYGANEVLIARAVVAGGQATIAYTRVNAKGTSDASAFGSGSDDDAALANAIASLSADWQETWKSRTATDTAIVNSLQAIVSFASLPEWVATRKRLVGISIVTGIDVGRISINEARVSIRFSGDRDLLDENLAEEGLMLEEDRVEIGYFRLVPYVPATIPSPTPQ